MEWVPRGGCRVWNGWAGSVELDCGFVSLIYSNHSLYYSNIRKSILVGNLTHRDIENYIDKPKCFQIFKHFTILVKTIIKLEYYNLPNKFGEYHKI